MEYFILFDVLINGIYFILSCLIDFYLLTLYYVTLLNAFN